MPRGRHESHGFSTTRWPTSKPSASGPSSTTSATTSWPITCGNEQKPLMALSLSPSPKSSRICFESDPQIPVSRGRVTSQSGRSGRASAMSCSATGVLARFWPSWLAPGGGVHSSCCVPKTSALIRSPFDARTLTPGGCGRLPPSSTLSARIGEEWRHAAAQRHRCVLPLPGVADVAHAHPRRDRHRPVDDARRVLLRAGLPGLPRSPAPAGPVPAPAGVRALRPRPPGVDRGRELRLRHAHRQRIGAPAPGTLHELGEIVGHIASVPARPQPPAVGAHGGRGPRARPRRPRHQDAPLLASTASPAPTC